MIDSIFVAMSGLDGHQRGLKVISNNVANMNTTGFKSTGVSFADVFNQGVGQDAVGQGVDASRTMLNLHAGEQSQTGRDLDLSVSGDGFFMVEAPNGDRQYTRAGATEFNSEGLLVKRGTDVKMLGEAADGTLGAVSIAGMKLSAPKATTKVVLSGNLSSTATEHAITSLVVYGKDGAAHTLELKLASDTVTAPGVWKMKAMEGTTEVGSAEITFNGSLPAPGSSPVALALAFDPASPDKIDIELDSDVTSFSSGTTSTLAVKNQDGWGLGEIATLKFDEHGVLKVGYSNGQTADGSRLVFAQLPDDAAVEQAGDGLFVYRSAQQPRIRYAGENGLKLSGQALELSNVDLTEEFSTLILMQRGYQASSQVLSTANDMLQELFEMKGRR